jgi:membrane protein YqaA with SNARE-associated domain
VSDFLEWIHGILEAVREWMYALAASPWAVWWLLGISFAESSFFPIPPDVLLIAMGLTPSAVADPGLNFVFAAICSVGSVLGGVLGYGIGYYGGRPLAVRFFKARRVETVERLYARWDVWAVAAAGFTPIPYKVFTITTGVLRAGFWRFVVASAASRSARFFLVATLLYFFNKQAEEILNKHIGPATLILVAVGVLGFVVLKLARRRGAGGEDGSGAAGNSEESDRTDGAAPATGDELGSESR